MVYLAAFAVWFAGFFLSVFNQANLILGMLSPLHARFGWLPSSTSLAPLFYRVASWCFWVAAMAVLVLTETLSFHWLILAGMTAAVLFLSELGANTLGWLRIRKKYPDAFDAYKFEQEMRNMFKP